MLLAILCDAAWRAGGETGRAARNSGAYFPCNQRLTVNLAPADLRKEAPAYDLPMALALVMASGGATPDLDGAMVVGEHSLDGSVRHTNGILPMVSVARQRGLKRVYVPARDAAEAALVEGLEVYPVANLAAMLDHLNGASPLARFEMPPMPKARRSSTPWTWPTSRGRSTSSGRWRSARPAATTSWDYGQQSNWRFAVRVGLENTPSSRVRDCPPLLA